MKNKLSKIFSIRTIVFIILLLEIIGAFLLYIFAEQYFVYVRTILSFVAIIFALVVFYSKRSNSYKVPWLLLIAVLPIFSSICYLLFSDKKLSKKDRKKYQPTRKALKIANANKESRNVLTKIDKGKDANAYFFGKYLSDYSDSGIFINTKITYFPTGQEAFIKMKEKLNSAKHYIFFEYFIVAEGKMWSEILEILKRKASEGVDVRVLYDDFGSLTTLPNNYYLTLRKFGIKSYAVNKIRPIVDVRMNNRDHRKILVIDGHTSFTGGINIADEYIGEKIRFGVWKDNAIMLEGNGTFGLTSLFLSTWVRISSEETEITDFTSYLPSKYEKEMGRISHQEGYVSSYGSGPDTYESVGANVYLNLIYKAKKSIYITTPYLILDEETLDALKNAAKGGIEVVIVTPHIPDKKMVFDLTRSYYKELIDSGVKIYEYTPGFIHQKVFLVDEYMATIGTVNLDFRSLFLHFENGCFIYKNKVLGDVRKDFDNILSESRMITKEMVNSSPLSKKLLRQILRVFASLL